MASHPSGQNLSNGYPCLFPSLPFSDYAFPHHEDQTASLMNLPKHLKED
jgi:hypothetical protein